MNFLDLFIAAALVWGAWKGFKRGFIYELFTFLALFLGLYAGIHFSDYAVNLLTTEGEEPAKYLPIIAFALTFLAVGAMVYFAGKALEKVIKVVQLSLLNKVIGGVFGALKFAFYCGAAIILLESYDEKSDILSDDTKSGSLFYNGVQGLVRATIPAFNESALFMKEILVNDAETEVEV